MQTVVRTHFAWTLAPEAFSGISFAVRGPTPWHPLCGSYPSMDLVHLALVSPLAVLAVLALFRQFTSPTAVLKLAEPAGSKPADGMGSLSVWVRQRLLPFFLVLLLLAAFTWLITRWPTGSNIVQLLLLTRYSLFGAAFLVGFVPLGLLVFPNLLANLFVLQRPLQLFNIAWLSVLAASMVVVTAHVVEVNAVYRYGTKLILPAHIVAWLRLPAVLVLGLPWPVACLVCSRAALPANTSWPVKSWMTGAALGLATGLGLVVLVTILQFVFLSAIVTDADLFPLHGFSQWLWEHALDGYTNQALYPLGNALAGLLADSPGFVDQDSGKLAPGHAQLLLLMGLVFAGYLSAYACLSETKTPDARSPFPALSYLLLLLLMGGFLLQGAAFALDRYQIPTFVAVLFFAFLQYQFANTDHFYYLIPPRKSKAGTGKPVVQLVDVLRNWQFPSTLERGNGSRPQRVLVAVAASGGGIQAAAWTCRVLTGLHELYVDELARSTFLISAVSGGSVGAMYYLDSWRMHNAFGLPPRLPHGAGELPAADSSLGRAMASSLEATAWGLAFPDFLRVLLPPLVARTDDRGARIETAWRRRLENPETRWSDWTSPILRGALPIPVFNSTIVETGQRFLASPVLGREAKSARPGEARQLGELYPGADPYVSTMVRLSATFPFVSPICRPWPMSGSPWREDQAYHGADGGYVDNEGLVTIIEWLYDLLDPDYFPIEDRQRKFDRILILRIVPFPAAAVKPAEQGRGWLYSTLGPLQALMNVRTSSQQERNDLAVQLFRQALRHVRTSSERERQDLAVRMFSKAIQHAQRDPTPEKKEELALLLFNEVASYYEVPVDVAKFTFVPTDHSSPPLSWMLTDRQKREICDSWQWLVSSPSADNPLKALDSLFRRRAEVEG